MFAPTKANDLSVIDRSTLRRVLLLRIGFTPRTRPYAAKYREDTQLFKQIVKETQKYASVFLLNLERFECRMNILGKDLDGICSMARNPTTLSLLSCFETLGIQVVNPVSSVKRCLDAASTLMFLQRRGVPIPVSSLHRRSFKDLEFPVILKNITSISAKARRTIVLCSRKELVSYTNFFKNGLWVAQRLLKKSALMKVYIVGKDVISIKQLQRTAAKNDQKHGTTSFPEISEASLLCGSLMNLEIYNVEWIIDREGMWVIDINDFPSFSGIPKAPRIIAHYLKNRFKK
jgi:ribosomal protein S6--L-glutamate ligase